MVTSVAPKSLRIGLMNNSENRPNSTPINMLRVIELPSSIWALLWSFCPSLREIIVPEPTPTIDPKAADRFMSGNVTASPDKAIGPTP